MKKILLLSILVLVSILFAGCKQKDSPQIDQLPGDYFPAFPNTWWEYRNIHNQLIKYEISQEYQECEGKSRPVFINIDKCIQGANLIYAFNAPGQYVRVTSPIYSLVLNYPLVCPISFTTFEETSSMGPPVEDIPFRRMTIKLDTNITLPNSTNYQNVILVKEYSLHNPNHRYIDYLAKNIGLIKRDSLNANDTTDLITILTLENYQIGK
jgi:hypothetical protein